MVRIMADGRHLSAREMYQNLSEEADELKKKINENLTHISEIDEYLHSIYKQEDEDFKVFSPRNVEHIYKEDIENHKTIKYKLENDNRILYSKLNKTNAYMEALEEVLESSKDSGQSSDVVQSNDTSHSFDVLKKQGDFYALDIQEKERQRIARDLHDTSLQNLAHLVHKIELASMYIDKDPLQSKLELASISKSLKNVIEEIRNTIFDLRPMSFDDLGLKESFERLFVKLKESNKAFDIYTEIDDVSCENELVLMSIFRVVQEACSNAIRHSCGNKLKVIIKQQNGLCDIHIEDNGCGFTTEDVAEKADRHFGIAVMKERIKLLGGSILFHSVPGKGTEIKINVPLNQK